MQAHPKTSLVYRNQYPIFPSTNQSSIYKLNYFDLLMWEYMEPSYEIEIQIFLINTDDIHSNMWPNAQFSRCSEFFRCLLLIVIN
jgi:hypothetical protein